MSLANELIRCRPWIEAALDYSRTHDFGDVVQGCFAGEMQLWPAPDGCLVTQVSTFPKRKLLQVFLAGGDMDAVLALADQAEEWGRAQGCDAMMMMGRMGWQRVLTKRGWDAAFVTMERKL